MPTYVYGCDTCGHKFEKFQKFADAPLTECPECGARIRKIFQPAGIVFKGSGWHYTDSRSAKSGASTEGGDKGGDAASPKTDGAKTDGAKPAETKAPAEPAKSASAAD